MAMNSETHVNFSMTVFFFALFKDLTPYMMIQTIGIVKKAKHDLYIKFQPLVLSGSQDIYKKKKSGPFDVHFWTPWAP